MLVNKRQHVAADDLANLPPDLIELILSKANVETKLTCALVCSKFRHQLRTSGCWPQEVRLDLHDSRQVRWLQKHLKVIENLSVYMEYTLIKRFNCMLRSQSAHHIRSLSIHLTPDLLEDYWMDDSLVYGHPSRSLFFELRSLRLLDLTIYHRGFTPVISTHNLPTTLRSLSFHNWLDTRGPVFFRASSDSAHTWPDRAVPWYFAHLLPPSVTYLRLTCAAFDLYDGLEQLRQCSNLEELDVYVHGYRSDVTTVGRVHGYDDLEVVLASLSVKRMGIHGSNCFIMFAPEDNVTVVRRTLFVGDVPSGTVSLRSHASMVPCQSITELTLHMRFVPTGIVMSEFSALKELVIADCDWRFGYGSSVPLLVRGLEAAAATLKHLTVSSNSEDTVVELPWSLRLLSFTCVCRGHLLLHCDVHMLSQCKDVLLGCNTFAGIGVELPEGLEEAVLEVPHPQPLWQPLAFTRPGLVGEWWHRVFQESKDQFEAGGLCGRARIWSGGRLCPRYLQFPVYGIACVHDDKWLPSMFRDDDDDGGDDE